MDTLAIFARGDILHPYGVDAPVLPETTALKKRSVNLRAAARICGQKAFVGQSRQHSDNLSTMPLSSNHAQQLALKSPSISGFSVGSVAGWWNGDFHHQTKR